MKPTPLTSALSITLTDSDSVGGTPLSVSPPSPRLSLTPSPDLSPSLRQRRHQVHHRSSFPSHLSHQTPSSVTTSSPPGHMQPTTGSTHQHQLQTQYNPRDIMCLRFNQEQNLFTCSTETGLRIYNVDPLMVKACLDPSEVGTISIVELLHRSNLIALVAGGSRQKYAENTVLVWDDVLKKFVLELTFATPVLAIRFRRDMIFVAERTRVHVFSFPNNVKKLLTIDTRENPRGLIEVSMYQSSERQVMVLPGYKTGTIQISDLTTITSERAASSAPVNIKAHKSDIACITLNNQGTRVATASTTGTLIRVFDTLRTTQLVELRRGTDPATLYCINFSPDSDFLCVSSDKGTVHVFALKDTHLNRRSSFAKTGLLGNYGDSQWALANFTVAAECACICGFGPKPCQVVAACVDGTFHKYSFNSEGSCVRDAFDIFADLSEEEEF